MKNIFLFGAGLFVSLNLLQAAPMRSSTSTDLAVMSDVVEQTTPTPAEEVPPVGTFYSAQNPGGPPLPVNVNLLPAWNLGNGTWLLDDLDSDYSAPLLAQRSTMSRTMGMDVPTPGGGDVGGGGGYTNNYVPYTWDTNQLWLEITNVSNDTTFANLHNGTNQVYAIWGATNLALPFADWQVETEVWPVDTNCQPFTVQNWEGLNLFLRAEDWTGVDSNGDGIPDWWIWLHFRNLSETATNLDNGGNTLLYDYTNGLDPNNVQATPVLLATISITDPVDIKWIAPSNLYVLSGSTATITEFDANGNTIRSLSSLGSNPSGIDVDAAGNVYVALTGGNQVWKFKPTTSSFQTDTNFGIGGRIGLTNGASGTGTNAFNAPFDVALSPDSGTISISDSGNNRIQQFSTNGTFTASFGSSGSSVGQFNAPKGLTYDSVGNLYIADSGNNRIVLANNSVVLGVSGTSGTALGQFNAPAGVSVNDRGIYVTDTGNNRIQSFNPLGNGVYSFGTSDLRFGFSTNFSQPFAVAAVDNLTNEIFYVADTGNNRVLLCTVPNHDADALQAVWNAMTTHIAAGDIAGAVSSFCSDTAASYQQAFSYIGTSDLSSDISQIGTLTPVFIRNDAAEYYFEKSIEGHTILFPVEFLKENGVWKIISF